MSNVCEATPIKSLFWDPSGLNKLLINVCKLMCFEFPSNLIGKLTIAFWVADVIPRETSSAAKSEEQRLFSQAKNIWGFFRRIENCP